MKHEDIKEDFRWANYPLFYGGVRLTLHVK